MGRLAHLQNKRSPRKRQSAMHKKPLVFETLSRMRNPLHWDIPYHYYRLITGATAVAREFGRSLGLKFMRVIRGGALRSSSPPVTPGDASPAEMQFWRQFNLSRRNKRKLWANVYCENRYSRSESFQIVLLRSINRTTTFRMDDLFNSVVLCQFLCPLLIHFVISYISLIQRYFYSRSRVRLVDVDFMITSRSW